MRLRIIAASVIVTMITGCSFDSASNAKDDSITASTTSTTAGTATPLPCPAYKTSTNVGTIDNASLDELSGLAKSSRNTNVLWTHNDSGDSARVFAITPNGALLTTIDMEDIPALDIEDIAVSHRDIWVADTGDNLHFRHNVQIHHFPEPEISRNESHISVDVKTIDIRYANPNGEGHVSIDSEAFFMDLAGNGYLVEKANDQQDAWVFQISAEDLRKSSATAKPVVRVIGNSNGKGIGPTAADLSTDGTTLAIKNYSETFIWRFTAESSVVAALKAQPKTSCIAKAGLGEAITFDGADLLTVEEGIGKPIRRTRASNR